MNGQIGNGGKHNGIAAFSPISTAAILAYAVLITVAVIVWSNAGGNAVSVQGKVASQEIVNQVDEYLPAVMAAPAEAASAADAAAVSERLQQIDHATLEASVKA